ncbi:MAG: hypothetical protein JWQ30_662, partial [Sediminibacterium sp.]|nr:hypothetical protein [Sediminibacterium sp.]
VCDKEGNTSQDENSFHTTDLLNDTQYSETVAHPLRWLKKYRNAAG